MIRSAASKVMWVGRATVFLVGLAVILALVFGVATTAMGANGKPFLLGKSNVATMVSELVNNGAGPALSLKVGQGQPPLAVNSSARVADLNADQIDGTDSTALQRRVSTECPAGSGIRAIAEDGTPTCETDDGGGTAPDSELLDGKDSSQFAGATHAHSGADITSGSVAEARIDGSIARDSEVMPTVEANDGKGSGLDADQIDGKDSSEFAAYERTVVVSPVGTPAQNGDALRSALAAITDASQSKAYLIQIEPGVYDVGSGALAMKEWVDMEGSGENNTKITRTGSAPPASDTLHGANNAELRSLTVEMAASGTNLAAIYNDGVSPRLTQITLITKNSTKAAGLYTDHGATSPLTGVTIKIESTESVGAILNGATTIRDSVIEATNDESTGINLELGSVEVHGSTVEGSAGRAIINFGNVRVGASQVIGGVTTAQGSLASAKCVASYNANFDPLSNSCQ